MRNRLQQLPLERERLLTADREGWTAAEETKAQLAQIERKRVTLNEGRLTLEARLSLQTASASRANELEAIVGRMSKRLHHLTFEERFQLVHAFIDRVVVHPDRGVEIQTFVPVPANDEFGPVLQPVRQYVMAATQVSRVRNGPPAR